MFLYNTVFYYFIFINFMRCNSHRHCT